MSLTTNLEEVLDLLEARGLEAVNVTVGEDSVSLQGLHQKPKRLNHSEKRKEPDFLHMHTGFSFKHRSREG